MKINTEIIKKLNPCKSRFDNYLKHYMDFNGTIEDFVELENISYDDKIWVITKLFAKKQRVMFAIKCASSVLYIFEEKYPDDKRPRLALEATEKWLNNPTQENAVAAANAAAYAANAAAYVANAAANAAAYAATCAAAYAAAYAATCAATYVANAAANAAAYVAEKETQLELNLIFAVEVANG